jgi:hypothetical protein
MRIYIACPYSKGDQAVNVRRSIDAAEAVAAKGHFPFNPLFSHFWHMIHPHDYKFWINQDLEWLRECQAVLRLSGESLGADAEVELAKIYGKPVFWSVEDIPTSET